MRKSVKIAFIVGLSLLLLGGMIFGGTVIAMKGDFAKANTEEFEYKSQTVTEEFSDIYIECGSKKVSVLPSTDGTCFVEYAQSEHERVQIFVAEGKLSVTNEALSRRWYEHISFMVTFKNYVRVYLPQKAYASLTAKGGSGEITLYQDLQFQKVDISVRSGNIEVNSSVQDSLTVNAGSGDIEVRGVSLNTLTASVQSGEIDISQATIAGACTVKASSGDIEMKNVSCDTLNLSLASGDVDLEQVVSAGLTELSVMSGDIELEGCDAGSYAMKVNSGSIRGSIRSGKVFKTKVSSGKARVPEDTAGAGICDISVHSGSVRIIVGMGD